MSLPSRPGLPAFGTRPRCRAASSIVGALAALPPRHVVASLGSFLPRHPSLLRRPVLGLARRRSSRSEDGWPRGSRPVAVPWIPAHASCQRCGFESRRIAARSVFHVALRFRRAARHDVKAAHSRIKLARGNYPGVTTHEKEGARGWDQREVIPFRTCINWLGFVPLCTFSEVEKRMRRLHGLFDSFRLTLITGGGQSSVRGL
jgi:hypothetical protein